MKKILKKILLILTAVVAALALFVGIALLYSLNYSVPEQAAFIENNTGLVQAYGRSLYDAQGQKLHLRGILVLVGGVIIICGAVLYSRTTALEKKEN